MSSAGEECVLLLEGLSCAACVAKVQKALEKVENVEVVQVNLAENTALISGLADEKALIQAVKEAGYSAEVMIDETARRNKQQKNAQAALKSYWWKALLALGLGAGLMLKGWIFGMTITLQNRLYWLAFGMVMLVVLGVTGGHFYRNAWQNLKKHTATMDSLITLGTGSAWLYSMAVLVFPHFFPDNSQHLYFDASLMIIGLINMGKMLEYRGKQQTSKALERLLDLTPATAMVVTAKGEKSLPLKSIKKEMILRLQTGERVAVDGEVVQGSGWIDESMLTGEPLAVEKSQGDKIHAGTLLTDGTLLFKATQVGNHTRLAQIIKLVRQAQSSKPPIGQLADKIASIFVPAVMGLAFFSSLIWFFFGPSPQLSYAFIIFTTVLIIACPCALGLATPMSIIAGIGRAAEFGILVRNADALQRAASVDTLVFDKTGTLTQGKPQMTAIECYGNLDENQAFQLAASLEQGASHPLAQAFVHRAKEKGLSLDLVENFTTIKGLGVTGMVKGQKLTLGNLALMKRLNIDVSQSLSSYEKESQSGATVIFFAVGNQLTSLFVVRDPLKTDSVEALHRLKKQGYHLVMLTGDQQATAQHIAQQAGINTVIAGVLPEGKVDAVKKLQAEGRIVAMIGDGINDAPALAQAEVSIAMGEGADIAKETAELTLMTPSIHRVADALMLSKAIMRNIKENLFGAFIYNVICLPLAAGVLYPLWGILINPIFGAVAMALSSTTVVLNANRLLTFKIQEK